MDQRGDHLELDDSFLSPLETSLHGGGSRTEVRSLEVDLARVLEVAVKQS